MTIKAIIWDMGGVLLHMGDEALRQELAAEYSISLRDIYHAMFDSQSAQVATIGEISVLEHWQNVGKLLGIPDAELEYFLRRFWGSEAIDYKTADLIRLARKSFKTGLLSNAWDNMRELIQDQWRFADVFDTMVISAEEGLAKPDPRIYHLAIERLGVTPQEAVFIDDILVNIEGAQQAGLSGIHFRTRAQTLQELEALLLTVNGEIPEDLRGQIQILINSRDSGPLYPPRLIYDQVGLEYQLNPQGRLVPYPGSTEQSCYLVHRHSSGYLAFFNQNLPERVVAELERLGSQLAFENPGRVLEALGSSECDTCSEPYLAYTFIKQPEAYEFADVRANDGRYEVLVDGQPVSWAWSVRENEGCAEVAVETLPGYRKRGYARQAVAAWAKAVLCQGRTPFYSHADSNQASAALAHSLGLVHFSTCISFERAE